jgi:hypothetical protein
MATATNIIVGLLFFILALTAFGVAIPVMLTAVVALLAAIAVWAYPWITR